MKNSIFIALTFLLAAIPALAQVTTSGFQNLPRAEAPGTLLSHPVTNGSEPIGRTTSINYLNGWIIVGAEQPTPFSPALRSAPWLFQGPPADSKLLAADQ
jgi:hypothetical protein